MEFAQILGAIHALILFALTFRSARRLVAPLSQVLCASLLLVWANLVYTGMLIATISQLDHRGLYFSVSVTLAAALEALLQFRHVQAPTVTLKSEIVVERGFPGTLRFALRCTLLLAALGSAAICLAYVPNNWDSCTYRFSRPFFYLAKGNLLHFGNPLDPRLLFYPFNGSLFYLTSVRLEVE